MVDLSFWEYICPCGAVMSVKFMQNHNFRCPECGRKQSKRWRMKLNQWTPGQDPYAPHKPTQADLKDMSRKFDIDKLEIRR